RGNLWLDGAEPWAELNWIGKHLAIGGAVLKIEERIERCSATTVDPETGRPNAPTLVALNQHFGHQDFGVYAVVVESGPIAVGDEWRLA
ncbi:MAG: MOSC domain-containing protein, partial [Cypionkella sp.]|nr:MOSC domain-containing protein [Cypionkella sp.]